MGVAAPWETDIKRITQGPALNCGEGTEHWKHVLDDVLCLFQSPREMP